MSSQTLSTNIEANQTPPNMEDNEEIQKSQDLLKHVPNFGLTTPLKRRTSFGIYQTSAERDKCHLCKKTIYAIEKVQGAGYAWHKSCFRCTSCKRVYQPNSSDCIVHIDGLLYCKKKCLTDHLRVEKGESLNQTSASSSVFSSSPSSEPSKSQPSLSDHTQPAFVSSLSISLTSGLPNPTMPVPSIISPKDSGSFCSPGMNKTFTARKRGDFGPSDLVTSNLNLLDNLMALSNSPSSSLSNLTKLAPSSSFSSSSSSSSSSPSPLSVGDGLELSEKNVQELYSILAQTEFGSDALPSYPSKNVNFSQSSNALLSPKGNPGIRQTFAERRQSISTFGPDNYIPIIPNFGVNAKIRPSYSRGALAPVNIGTNISTSTPTTKTTTNTTHANTTKETIQHENSSSSSSSSFSSSSSASNQNQDPAEQ